MGPGWSGRERRSLTTGLREAFLKGVDSTWMGGRKTHPLKFRAVMATDPWPLNQARVSEKMLVNFNDWKSVECFNEFLQVAADCRGGALGHLGLGANLAETWCSSKCFFTGGRKTWKGKLPRFPTLDDMIMFLSFALSFRHQVRLIFSGFL